MSAPGPTAELAPRPDRPPDAATLPDTRLRRLRRLLPLLLLLGATGALYSTTWGHDFAWDDRLQITQGQLIQDPSRLGELFTADAWDNVTPGADRRAQVTNLYRPLQTASFMASWAWHGADPRGYHVENTALHLATLALFFLLLRRLGVGRRVALLATAFAALHPVQVEAVAWISGRSDPAVTLGVLLALLAHLHARRPDLGRQRRAAAWLAVTLCQLLALGFKESAIILPALLVLVELLLPALDGLPRPAAPASAEGRRGPAAPLLRRLTAAALPALVGVAIYLGARLLALGGLQAGTSVLDPLRTLLEAPSVVVSYLRLYLFPNDLTVIHPFRPVLALGLLHGLLGGMLGLGLGLAWAGRRREGRPAGALAWLVLSLGWFLVALAPAVMQTLVTRNLAERYLYLPGLGLALAAALGVDRWLRRVGPGLLPRLLVATLLVALAGTSWLRSGDWQNDEMLLMAAVDNDPEEPEALYRLGTAHMLDGERFSAVRLLVEAHRLVPTEPRYAANLGWLMRERGSLAYARRVMLKPLVAGRQDATLLVNLGLVELELAVRGRQRDLLELARQRFETALRLVPGHRPTLEALAELERLRPRLDGAAPPLPAPPAAP